ncbi:MAG: ABC transporter ATP-binding protein [Epulopiscium sp.]|nr:ABC transporter ATP-binding protein [Candidatus Epulonipiscium sp.]
MNKIIQVTNLKKSYGNIKAVNNIDFYVESGKLFAFLGPNGAGKSTTIDIISTLLKADSGKVQIDGNLLGKDDSKIKSIIGVVFQDSLLDPLLTVKENLYVRGSFYNLPKFQLDKAVRKAADSTGVTEFLDRPYGKLSGGQRRRADIARALINTPKILFLDEPTTGLDPQTRKNVWETIQQLQKESGMTVFLTTHYMEEATTADYVVVIDNGEIAAQGTPLQLKEQYSSDVLKIQSNDSEKIIGILNEQNVEYTIHDKIISIKLANTLEAIPLIEKCKNFMIGFEVLNGTMDDAFIGITGREIRE